jgi:hypothetical protein
MLGHESWIFSFASDSGHVQRFTNERGQRHGIPQEGATSGVNGAIDFDHYFPFFRFADFSA